MFVAVNIVPELLGDRAGRIRVASRSSWWGLKEGTFALSNPHVFSSCNRLMPNGKSKDVRLWPSRTITEVLTEATQLAGLDPTQGTGAAIVASTGDLRKSWLLRHPLVGLTLVERNVTPECIDGSLSFCYGTNWLQSRKYAPTREAALQSISDLATIFGALSP